MVQVWVLALLSLVLNVTLVPIPAKEQYMIRYQTFLFKSLVKQITKACVGYMLKSCVKLIKWTSANCSSIQQSA
jgi:hypothetical protein